MLIHYVGLLRVIEINSQILKVEIRKFIDPVLSIAYRTKVWFSEISYVVRIHI